jgi:hypothetical protein
MRGLAVRLSPTQTEWNPKASARSAMCKRPDGSALPDMTASRVGSKMPNFILVLFDCALITAL